MQPAPWLELQVISRKHFPTCSTRNMQRLQGDGAVNKHPFSFLKYAPASRLWLSVCSPFLSWGNFHEKQRRLPPLGPHRTQAPPQVLPSSSSLQSPFLFPKPVYYPSISALPNPPGFLGFPLTMCSLLHLCSDINLATTVCERHTARYLERQGD